MRILAPKDFWSGVMFCGFAAVAILAAYGYSLGSAGKMGPGYFPLLLAALLAVLGATLIARSVVLSGENRSRTKRSRPSAVLMRNVVSRI